MRGRPLVSAGFAALVLLAAAATASALEPIDAQVQAEASLTRLGFDLRSSVEPAGDVNGDGKDDLIVPAPFAVDSTGAYVLFGPLPRATDVEQAAGQTGFKILNSSGFAFVHELEGVGDVNGDGLDDIALGGLDGRVYVVFGSVSTATVDVSHLGTRGFVIESAGGAENISDTISDAGDVNGDRRDDIALLHFTAAGGSRVAVVFGKASGSTVDVSALGANGYEILQPSTGGTLSDLGGGVDVNGDALDDVIAAYNDKGAYVVFGQAGTGTLDPTAPGKALRLTSTSPVRSIAEAGDVNGDGLGDVVAGMTSRATVVFGRASTAPVNLAAPRTGGFIVRTANARDQVIWVKPAGDLDLDGFDDIVVSPATTAGGVTAFAVFGRPAFTAVSLASPGARGYRLDRRGFQYEGLGDVVADRLGDLGGLGVAVSAPRDLPNGDCTVRGTNAAEILTGTAGPDVICGLGGNDQIDGLGGDDVILGGDGADSIRGGLGDDLIAGGAGSDFIRADDGDDRAAGGTGNDRIEGGTGPGLLSGGEGNDLLFGSTSPDHLLGGPGVDRLDGGPSNDVLEGEDGNDTLNGNEDADELLGGGQTDHINGGTGNDVIRGDNSPSSNTPGGGDVIHGNEDDDQVFGDFGSDQLFGDAGNDRVEGGGGGNDLVDGGTGNDILESGTRLLGGDGDDTLTGRLYLDGGAGDDVITGSEIADQLLGGAGNDHLFGLAGNDTLRGGADDDELVGGANKDKLFGEAGDDALDSVDGLADADSCGIGVDRVDHDAKDTVSADCENRTLH